jgi:hypothetical protein
MKLRILTFTFATSIYLLAVHPARAEEIQFQSGGGQSSQSGGAGVQTVELGDVTGTVCDCGEVTPPLPDVGAGNGAGRGFPKMALLAGAALPGIIPFIEQQKPRRSHTEVSRTTSSVPEPLTLTTLAAGLAILATLRKRRV